MLYPIYKKIQTLLLTIEEAKAVQWYNAQYDAAIPRTPVIFIEFPDAYAPTDVTKQLKEGPLRIRIHVASKVLTGHDNNVPDSAIELNETIGTSVMSLLKKNTLDGDIKPLQFVSWQHWHRWQGWMVTLLEFEGTLIL
jgi:hypothetical protein